MSPRPLSEGNRFQRWYHAWAAPYYARMPEDVRTQAEAMDRFLYSRRGLGLWAGLLCAVAGTTAGLRMAGLSTLSALLVSVLAWGVLPLVGLSAWLMPNAYLATGKTWRYFRLGLAGALAGALAGFTAGHVARTGGLDLVLLWQELLNRLTVLAPAVLLAATGYFGILWTIARARRALLERELQQLTVQHERDAAARQAAEARLKLLQAQIQPHFIFNTLAALQHWVDTGDARAPALLRTLTAFLRGSTELLGREVVALGDEVAAARQYLAIMQARLGERLRFEVDLGPGCDAVPLPPGLLLTLVENAVEHGIAPALGGGTVRIAARLDADGTLTVQVRDDGVGLPPGGAEGTGLANSRERLRHHGDGRGSLTLRAAAPGTEATLRLPGAAP